MKKIDLSSLIPRLFSSEPCGNETTYLLYSVIALSKVACTYLPFTFSRESVLSNELREVRAEHVLLQEDYTSAIHCRDQALSEKADLQSKCQSQRSIIDTLNDQLERLVHGS